MENPVWKEKVYLKKEPIFNSAMVWPSALERAVNCFARVNIFSGKCIFDSILKMDNG